ncbi:hypothetical protein GALMADRAFT_255782 [Galerina marginata CBS 339.88]|uniref:Uncharacterized protein n=1 Tax=Galerina marginata (strain CBS 339.88) TaxID=685588 RepID=A0A067SPF9_GALM3|nr:hypothetical protein GALMADRAFT_255782 [Galerina marginata CBS 339.88]
MFSQAETVWQEPMSQGSPAIEQHPAVRHDAQGLTKKNNWRISKAIQYHEYETQSKKDRPRRRGHVNVGSSLEQQRTDIGPTPTRRRRDRCKATALNLRNLRLNWAKVWPHERVCESQEARWCPSFYLQTLHRINESLTRATHYIHTRERVLDSI